MDGRGLGAKPPRKFMKITPFTLAINVTNAIFHIKIALEKHEEVVVLENKESMFVTCWQ